MHVIVRETWEAQKDFLKSKLFECGKDGMNEEKTHQKILDSARLYTNYTSYVLVASKKKNFSFKTRPGFGFAGAWKDDPKCESNLWVYSVSTSELKSEKGKCNKEHVKNALEKAKAVLTSFAHNQGSTKNSSMDSLVEEIASKLNQASVPWLVIELGERGDKNDQGYSTWTDFSNIQIDWSDKSFQGRTYDMKISLPKSC